MAIYEVVLEGRFSDQDMLTVLHYDITGDENPNWQAMADAIRFTLNDFLTPFLVTAVDYVGITVREDVEGSVGLFVPFTLGTLTGSDSDDGIISQAAVLVRKLANTLTRPTQGRIYQGGISSQYLNSAGLWTAVATTPIESFWSDMVQLDFGPGSLAQMVIKASNPTAPNTVPYNPVETIATRSIPVVQRRRKFNQGS